VGGGDDSREWRGSLGRTFPRRWRAQRVLCSGSALLLEGVEDFPEEAGLLEEEFVVFLLQGVGLEGALAGLDHALLAFFRALFHFLGLLEAFLHSAPFAHAQDGEGDEEEGEAAEQELE